VFKGTKSGACQDSECPHRSLVTSDLLSLRHVYWQQQRPTRTQHTPADLFRVYGAQTWIGCRTTIPGIIPAVQRSTTTTAAIDCCRPDAVVGPWASGATILRPTLALLACGGAETCTKTILGGDGLGACVLCIVWRLYRNRGADIPAMMMMVMAMDPRSRRISIRASRFRIHSFYLFLIRH
jgi:hypothetical protein